MMKNRFLIYICILCIGIFINKINGDYVTHFSGFENCYTGVSDKLITTGASVQLVRSKHHNYIPAIEIWIESYIKEKITNGNYKINIWHQETGGRIKYKGPYDFCCGFMYGSECKHYNEVEEDCPYLEYETILGFVEKPLHQIEFGHYEVTFTATTKNDDGEEEDLICVIIPFIFEEGSIEYLPVRLSNGELSYSSSEIINDKKNEEEKNNSDNDNDNNNIIHFSHFLIIFTTHY
eukprot:TRINITY_DN1257_c0_g4_i1.p1 TRINITY_DN1257_c0_g4~~TRINITY_DN1257_c0_g4_i1.p1  ORF type:complete len:235 (+),score=56.36 TRINITY_DN1257_c0_g4_i1:112-816(+)